MINKTAAEALKDRLGFKNAFGVASRGRAGGLCIYWKEEVLFSLISFSQHHICGDIDDGTRKWRFIGVYGWAKEEEKCHTWSLLRHLCEDSSRPILLGGDFNEILSYDEKEGGVDRVRREITHFRDTVNDLSLRDLGYVGVWHTWERGNSFSTCIRERLDRFLCTSSWLELYPNSCVEHSIRYKSDHSAIILRPTRISRPAGQRRFFFESSWLLDAGCEELVRSSWLDSAGQSLPGRVTSLGQNLVNWSGQKFRNLGKKIEAAEKQLLLVQQHGISDASIRDRLTIEKQLDDLHSKHEAYWYLRSRVAEVRDGDRNTKYFHHKASQRRKRNQIKGLLNAQGEWREDIDDIESIFTNYFASIFSSNCPTDVQFHEVLKHIDPVISVECNQHLTKPFTKDEIYLALQQMHPCKAPGPDGMHALFYQRFWHIVGDDVTSFVCSILHGSLSPRCVNHTNLALIPKVKSPSMPAEFRPIALCNVIYKLVSKAIVMRLKDFLPAIVTENQSAFVPGRQITDNALIALEVFHSMKYRNKSRKGMVSMKLDMSKAYDRVEWGFLRKLLLTMGFDGRWVNLIMECVSSVSYSFIINRGVRGSIVPSRGLRQGDPLSPYLFILVADAFLMGVYKLPCSIIQKIHSAMARFWWGNSDSSRKVHWKSWETMCTLKCLGGMGFKDLSVFNDALLGRQAWRLIREPNSLLAKVMKAKYYPNCNFLEASLGQSCSYSWSSIWSSKALLKEGVVWRVGNGTQINIWDDPWIVDEDGRYISSSRTADLNWVSDLIDYERMEWKVEEIEDAFNDRDVRCILGTPLSTIPMRDELTWAFTKDANYSVKTAYMLGKGGNLENFHQAWVDLWTLDVSPKVRHFLWRMCSNSLPVRHLLKHRHMTEDDKCPWGCGEAETQGHALFGCPSLRDIWLDSGCDAFRANSLGHPMSDVVVSWRALDKKIIIKGCFLAWCLWGDRNSMIFNSKKTPHHVLFARVNRYVEENGSYMQKIYHTRVHPQGSPRKWVAPPDGIYKINVDASLAVDGWIGLGVIVRDAQGTVLFAAVRRVRAHWSAEIAEAKAIEMALRLGQRYGLKEVIVESDCQTVVSRLSKNAIFLSDLDVVLHSILSSSLSFFSISWSHVKRDGNFVAHHLAKLIPFGVEQIWENHDPPEVAPYVLMDTLSLE
ncbi:uncharacterized protein LOC125494918 [Beta vulgaris subsp. vulgaris]|uniref:uncharacterized protein LOC125494918 n=1 Tax=Beta vulgaris subsp. vulgaris TaxID=3555 RepID=UPI0020372DE4|nr:uncharacterized protein LOC125494918 [Beta vulgaris subsp. vulgaris]